MIILLKCIEKFDTNVPNFDLSRFEIMDSIESTANIDLINNMVNLTHGYSQVYKLWDRQVFFNVMGIYPLYHFSDWEKEFVNVTVAAILVNSNHENFKALARTVLINKLIK